jgi:hypothetical protein
MFSLRTTRACVLFFVQIFPSLFSAIAVFWSLKERRERESRRKEICVQITQIFYEWTHRGEKGKNSLFAHIHTRRFPFFFFSLILVRCSYLFLLLLVLIVSNFGSTKSSLSLSLSPSLYIYNCNRLAHTGRNMLLNQVLFLSLLKNIMLCLFSLICSLITCHPSPSLWEVHCYSVQMMSSKKEAPLSLSLSLCCAHSIALSLDLKPCRTSRLLLVNNNNNNNKDIEQQQQHQ